MARLLDTGAAQWFLMEPLGLRLPRLLLSCSRQITRPQDIDRSPAGSFYSLLCAQRPNLSLSLTSNLGGRFQSWKSEFFALLHMHRTENSQEFIWRLKCEWGFTQAGFAELRAIFRGCGWCSHNHRLQGAPPAGTPSPTGPLLATRRYEEGRQKDTVLHQLEFF